MAAATAQERKGMTMRTIRGWLGSSQVKICSVSIVIMLGLCSIAGAVDPFVNVTVSVGLGISSSEGAWGDYNNDGLVDLLAGGKVWRNDGGWGPIGDEGSFTEVHAGGGRIFGDYNNDGYLDLFKQTSGGMVYRNNAGTGTFVNVTVPSQPSVTGYGVNWGDYNGDGYLDIYTAGGAGDNSISDMILWNNGNSTFTAGTQSLNVSYTRGVTSCDWDEDGDLDVYGTNYRLEANALLQNNGSGVFSNVAGAKNATGGSGHGIGSAWGDFDNDGHFDLFAGNFSHNVPPIQPQSRFLRNKGSGFDYAFEDMGTGGIPYQESYATPAFADFDNDGDLDLYFTTVYDETQTTGGVENHGKLFRNDGSFGFTDVSTDYGFPAMSKSYQAAWADYDNDGYMDLLTQGALYQNPGGSNHWLKVKLVGGTGPNGLVDKAGIGGQVRISVDHDNNAVTADIIVARQVEAGTGEGNQNEMTMHFGLGSWSGTVDLDIEWLDGTSQTVNNVSVDQLKIVNITPGAPIPGDVNGDFRVAGGDLTTVITYWGQSGLGREFGDLNGNGIVDGPDYTEVITYWGTGPGEPPSGIPEPATLGLLLAGGLIMMKGKSKN